MPIHAGAPSVDSSSRRSSFSALRSFVRQPVFAGRAQPHPDGRARPHRGPLRRWPLGGRSGGNCLVQSHPAELWERHNRRRDPGIRMEERQSLCAVDRPRHAQAGGAGRRDGHRPERGVDDRRDGVQVEEPQLPVRRLAGEGPGARGRYARIAALDAQRLRYTSSTDFAGSLQPYSRCPRICHGVPK